MKNLFLFLFLAAGMLLITACEETELNPAEPTPQIADQFTVPDIPADIEAMLSPEDIALFKAGPGEEYINAVRTRSLGGHANGPARWHPVMIHMGYNLQFVPLGGTSCDMGDFEPCFGPGAPADPTDCLANMVGTGGIAFGDGKWLGSDIHSEYYPVFCLPDAAGYGEGYMEAEEGVLWFSGTSTPHIRDDEGDKTFYLFGTYVPEQSTGIFEGAFGWETAFVFTAAENDPEQNNGIGYSDVVIYGWVFF